MPSVSNNTHHNEQQQQQTNDYTTALSLLLSQQSQTPSAIHKRASRRRHTIFDMREYMRRINLPYYNHQKRKNPQKLIHITGTKGKGSTASMTESILRHVYRHNTGLFTSPHLVTVNERIRLNGKPVSDDVFAEAYFEVRRRLLLVAEKEQKEKKEEEEEEGCSFLEVLPGYFQMLTLVALFIFAHYKFDDNEEGGSGGGGVDVMILEVGMGGRYDATNVFEKTMTTGGADYYNSNKGLLYACGVSLIDYDHMRVLGNSLEEIAWEKGGIFRHIALTGKDNKQEEEGEVDAEGVTNDDDDDVPRFFTIEDNNRGGIMNVLRRCAGETISKYDNNDDDEDGDDVATTSTMTTAVEGRLEIVTRGRRIDPSWTIGIGGDHQRINAELAVALCESLARQDSQRRRRRREQRARTTNENDKQQEEKDLLMCHDETSLLRQTLRDTVWPGRCHTISLTGNLSLHCDGAHTEKSLEACLAWFQRQIATTTTTTMTTERVLIFNCSHERDPITLLQHLFNFNSNVDGGGSGFKRVYFCCADSERPSAVMRPTSRQLLRQAGIIMTTDNNETNYRNEETTWQETLGELWNSLEVINNNCDDNRNHAATTSTVETSFDITTTVNHIRNDAINKKDTTMVHVLVVGSLYIVGSVLNACGWREEVARGTIACSDDAK